MYKHEADVFNPGKQEELFEWMIEKFDLLVDALVSADELDNEEPSGEKFSEIKKYLESCGKSKISLTFAEVEILSEPNCADQHIFTLFIGNHRKRILWQTQLLQRDMRLYR